MKNKLDLNNLLAKYQGISGSTGTYYSPTKQYVQPQLQKQFYQRQNYQPHHNKQPLTGQFQMSRSQCQQFLLKTKQDLKNQSKSMTFYAQSAMKQIHQNFQKQHQRIKRQILQLLQRSFNQNQKRIRQQLIHHSKQQPPEFAAVNQRIQAVYHHIDKLLYQLKGGNYRKAIAEVVLKDFTEEVHGVRDSIQKAKDNYIQYLGQVHPDNSKIECIKEDLKLIFKVSKKHGHIVGNAFMNLNQQKNIEISSRHPIQQSHLPQERTRKSFFNFGFE